MVFRWMKVFPETRIMCDNQAVVRNSSEILSAFDEEHSTIACHFTGWCVTAKIDTNRNLAEAKVTNQKEQVWAW